MWKTIRTPYRICWTRALPQLPATNPLYPRLSKKKLRKAEDESAKFVIITPGVFRLPSPYIQAHLLTGFL